MTEAEKAFLEAVLGLLDESKKLHEGGYFEAHSVAAKARKMLAFYIQNGGVPDDQKPAT